ncbi:MAG: hypothetical protein ACRDD4_05655 [Culicoidibacterales bacterium]
MAQVTVELGTLLAKTNFKLFDFEYEFDDPIMKDYLEKSIISHFYFYEIGEETPDRFKHRFKNRWTQVIYYYNKLHNTTVLKYNPLTTISQIEKTKSKSNSSQEQESKDNTNSNTNSTGLSTSDSKNYDFPQTQIPGGDFATNGFYDKSTTGGDISNNTNNSSELTNSAEQYSEFERELIGSTGLTYQDLIKLERENIINIQLQIIEDMKQCFILCY